MEIKKVKEIQTLYKETKSHEVVMEKFGLNHAQEYAINILGRDKHLPAAFLADYIDNLTEGMTIGDVAVELGFQAEDVL